MDSVTRAPERRRGVGVRVQPHLRPPGHVHRAESGQAQGVQPHDDLLGHLVVRSSHTRSRHRSTVHDSTGGAVEDVGDPGDVDCWMAFGNWASITASQAARLPAGVGIEPAPVRRLLAGGCPVRSERRIDLRPSARPPATAR
jgi:hypothetical protein